MPKDKASLEEELKGKSYKEMGEFFDSHSMAEYWDETKEVDEQVEIDPVSGEMYYLIEKELSDKLRSLAKQKGMPAGEILNSWLREKLKDVEI